MKIKYILILLAASVCLGSCHNGENNNESNETNHLQYRDEHNPERVMGIPLGASKDDVIEKLEEQGLSPVSTYSKPGGNVLYEMSFVNPIHCGVTWQKMDLTFINNHLCQVDFWNYFKTDKEAEVCMSSVLDLEYYKHNHNMELLVRDNKTTGYSGEKDMLQVLLERYRYDANESIEYANNTRVHLMYFDRYYMSSK